MGYTIKASDENIKILIEKYKEYSIEPNNNYTLFQAKFNTSTITIFKTNTILIQGKNEENEYIEICNAIGITPTINKEEKPKVQINALQSFIGTDEVGTGDVFGGVVVAGAFVSKDDILYLKNIGVRDSKEISDYKINEIAPEIMKFIPHSYYVLDNIHFNFLSNHYKLNMNNIKALLHNSVINNMKQKVKNYDGIIIDAFTTAPNYFNYLKNEKIVARDVILEEKAENKYISVACASIIARYIFLKEMDKLSDIVGFELPKGAGKPVDTAIKKIANEKGTNIFKNIAKVNFKNFDTLKNK